MAADRRSILARTVRLLLYLAWPCDTQTIMQLHWKCSLKVECSSWGSRVENTIVHLLLDCSSTWNTIVPHQFQIGTKIDPGTYHNHKGNNWGHTPFDYKHHGLAFHWWGGEILGAFISYGNVRELDWFEKEFNSPQLPFAACPVKHLSDFSQQSGSVATEKGLEVLNYFNRREMEEKDGTLWKVDFKHAYSNHVRILERTYSYNCHLSWPMIPVHFPTFLGSHFTPLAYIWAHMHFRLLMTRSYLSFIGSYQSFNKTIAMNRFIQTW